MKGLGLVVLTAFLASNVMAKTLQLNDVQFSNKVLRGAVLALPSKKLLSISGVENYSLSKELGEKKKNALFVDFIMNTPAKSLEKKYNTNKNITAGEIIKKYARLNPDNSKISAAASQRL